MKFSERMGELVRRMLSCCDSSEEERPMLKISAPTNFRREDVSIPELNEMQQTFIREVAKHDAKEMYEGLQPLRSSPSSTFTDRPTPPAYEDLEPARAASPRHMLDTARRISKECRLDRVRAHSRKISDALTKPLSFNFMEHVDSRHELRALMGDDHLMFLNAAKLSTESFSVAGSEEDRVMRNKF